MQVRRGFVLIAALWLIVALSAVGLEAALRTQARRAPAVNHLDASRSREAASAGVEFARSRLTAVLLDRAAQLRAERGDQDGRSARQVLTTLSQEDPWHAPQQIVPAGLTFADAEFTLALQDAGERLNINEATEAMIRSFLAQGLRTDYALADRITQAILDWRDADELPRVNGGERDQYVEAGAAILPSNHAFASTDELRHVLGMTAELHAAMEPYVTVMGSGRININAASEPVLLAVPTLTPAAVTTLLRFRAGGRFIANRGELGALLGRMWQVEGREAQEFTRRVTYATNEVEIVATGRTREGPVQRTVRALAIRSDRSAIVIWRRFE